MYQSPCYPCRKPHKFIVHMEEMGDWRDVNRTRYCLPKGAGSNLPVTCSIAEPIAKLSNTPFDGHCADGQYSSHLQKGLKWPPWKPGTSMWDCVRGTMVEPMIKAKISEKMAHCFWERVGMASAKDWLGFFFWVVKCVNVGEFQD